MLEVVFSDSAKGSMSMAIKQDKENFYNHDVVCIGLNLDIGDISGTIDGVERKKEFVRVFSSVKFKDEEIEQFFNMQRDDYEKLIRCAKDRESIRVWKSNAAFSACAYAFVCYTLKDIDCDIREVTLPEFFDISRDTIKQCADWGEIAPDEFKQFLHSEKKISDAEKRYQSNIWDSLKKENAPLRAVVNGKLISVCEDFYDHLIIKHIPKDSFVMARLIGTVLGSYSLGVSDGWYALRINKMIDENKLQVVLRKDKSYPYGAVLQKRD
ncbi:MAG: DUF1835 domain-containing protein [Eubacteriaceae bacterium]|nr:DUF1835 domain-containing protein [Eubacteriaceae bacterium]